MTPFERDDPQLVDHFRRTGWVAVAADPVLAAALPAWADELAGWPVDTGVLHYHELTDTGPALCRAEHFVPFHADLRNLLTTGPMIEVAGRLLGEPAVLYKEKLNYKSAGGAGYAPHQDAPAYRFIETHVSCMVAIDPATVANGCLEVVSGVHHEVLPMDDAGCIRPDVVAAMRWDPVEVPAGGMLWFHSRAPHRSGPNRSRLPRRALYPTYNAASEGDRRADYYRQKLAEFGAATDETASTVRVSLIGDFQGRPVPRPAPTEPVHR